MQLSIKRLEIFVDDPSLFFIFKQHFILQTNLWPHDMDDMELHILLEVQLDSIDVHESRLHYQSVHWVFTVCHFTAIYLNRVLRLIE